MIGSICLWNFSKDKKIAEIGYDLSPQYQGKAIMDESLKGVLRFGFDELNLDSIEAYTNRLNESSKNLLVKNGFKRVWEKKDEDNLDNIIYEIKKTAAKGG
jgi:ribosomal-protein-alanine N-acetyltransferase